ncbi:helix-turn-helix domain-containing protein [Halovulum dunhuangense]|uniref:Helix-turn-helix domain-containing protein n=1 Tax=Halovulum dunhuangense TaxID=1505036 RepID=A0A849L4N0_9RHOB|nr:helix-turn-helix domain-containing protein [Halovulum dunhuangense]NNU81154.1 helix-turn-helix domain-containing protein [Halovulum dunhuangense]
MPAPPEGRAVKRHLAEGQVLFHEGDHAHFIYEILSGVLRLTRYTEAGRRQVIAFGYPGDMVGFPDHGRHRAECDVVAPADVVVHRTGAFDNPAMDLALHGRLVSAALAEISCMQDHFVMLGRKSAIEKTAAFLAALLPRVGVGSPSGPVISLPMSRADIADFLGLTTETVCRSFSRLRALGVIQLRGAQTVVVRDPGRLLELAESD